MISFLYMKILETQPRRYDLGLSLLSFGGINRIRRRIVRQYLSPGAAVLDIGAGTGALAGLMARGGMDVTAFDPSAAMLAVARERWETEQAVGKLKLMEAGVAQMDSLFGDGSFDAATACLVFSELSPDELRYALEQIHRVLRPGGRLVVADEFRPRSLPGSLLYHLFRLPLLVITFLLTQTSTNPLPKDGLPLPEGKFKPVEHWSNWIGSFRIVVAEKVG